MITTHFYLDSRAVEENQPAPLKVAICKKGKVAYIHTGIKVKKTEWDAINQRTINIPNKNNINLFIANKKVSIDNHLMQLITDGSILGMNVVQIKNKLLSLLSPDLHSEELFTYRVAIYSARCKKDSTKEKYNLTLKRIREFDKNADSLKFEDINKDWLQRFDTFLSLFSPAKNSRNIHFRNIRAVFNDAIDNNITNSYPFRKFKIIPAPTIKRSLSVEQLRQLFNYPVENFQQRYLDIFKLSFFLIGINMVDLYHLDCIKNNRIEYIREKTGKLYSIKIEPEAMEIIDRYKGKEHLLDLSDIFTRYQTCTMKFDKGLQNIGKTEMVLNKEWHPKNKKRKYHTRRISEFPGLSMYWARHSWATIAAELDIPKETIAAALGHGGNSVTDIYINFDIKKVDEANRKVIDYVLGKQMTAL